MREAAAVPPGAAGVTLLPYFTGDRSPFWLPRAQGAMHGLTLNHSRAHLARAALEGVAFCLADVWDAMPTATRRSVTAHLAGGITRSPLWCRIVADVLGIELLADDAGDASALGAARLAHVVLGHARDLTPPPHKVERYQPAPASTRIYGEAREQFRALRLATGIT
jgi:sugar (pentulose or hexulose) kinase